MNILLYVTQQKMKDKGNGFLAMKFKRFYSVIKNIQVEMPTRECSNEPQVRYPLTQTP